MEPGFAASDIDTSRPHPARMYNYYLGGKDNYFVDQEAAREALRHAPELRLIARENRAFLQRAVRFLVAEAGIRQIIDIGTGIPAAGNVHEIAHQIAPEVRVVYVDNDPIVHVHASALLTGSGTTRIVLADVREPELIITDPSVRELIDFDEPAALLLVAVLHFVTDGEDPPAIVAAFRNALPTGSYLALSHATADFRSEAASRAAAVYDRATASLTLRSHDEIASLFEGFGLVSPGLVQLPLWRPGQRPPRDLSKIMGYCGVGRKAP
jgi:S-adenosyl methyltransferase